MLDFCFNLERTFMCVIAAAAAKSFQSCPTLHNPMDCRSSGSSIHGIFPGKNTGVGCHSFFNAWKWKVKVKSLSHVQLFVTPWTAAYQPPPSLGLSRQEYWSEVPFPSPMHACMLNSFSCVWPCVTPETVAHQGPPSLGFSRQEHWSGLPFPSLMHESEVAQSCLTDS